VYRTCNLCEAMCGIAIGLDGDRIVSIRGDEDDPFSRGHVCPKAVALQDVHDDPDRLRRPLRRRGTDWEEISWDDAVAGIARHIKDTRDRCFVAKNAKGQTVNRNPGMGVIGGCTDTNEFNFLQWKFISALGVPYRDSQARV
jgi:anaerobic selenocysteine-containing dehydrogenase